MNTTTKLLALGAMGAAAYGVARVTRRSKPTTDVDSLFDASDVHDISDVSDTTSVETPIVVTEEVIVISEPGPYDVDLDLIPDSRRGTSR
jgi:hypothetical protein